jgi:hypothetical protein
MKFFIPAAKDKTREQEVYNGIKKFLAEEHGCQVTDRKIFSLQYQHNSQEYYAEVDQPHPQNGETVVAILYGTSHSLYYICTLTRGVAQGVPIYVGAHDVRSVVEFEPE